MIFYDLEASEEIIFYLIVLPFQENIPVWPALHKSLVWINNISTSIQGEKVKRMMFSVKMPYFSLDTKSHKKLVFQLTNMN